MFVHYTAILGEGLWNLRSSTDRKEFKRQTSKCRNRVEWVAPSGAVTRSGFSPPCGPVFVLSSTSLWCRGVCSIGTLAPLHI